MNNDEKLCRFCLKQLNHTLFGDVEMICNMLSTLNLKMNLDITEKPVICADCTENVHRLFIFKKKCVETEDRLLHFIIPQVDKKINLQQIFLQMNDSKSLDDKDVCRFCLCETLSDSSVQLSTMIDLTSLTKNYFEIFFPEMDLNLVRDPVVCKICHNSLLECLTFTQKCLNVEENIQRYFEIDAVDVNEKVDLRRVQQFLDREAIKGQLGNMNTFQLVKHEMQREEVKEEQFSEEDIKSENFLQIEDSYLDVKDELELKFVVDASISAAIEDVEKQEIEELIKKRGTPPICESPASYECDKCSFETESTENYYPHSELHKDYSYIKQSNRCCEHNAKQKCYSQLDMVHQSSIPIIKLHERKHDTLNKQKVTYKNSSKVLMHRRKNEGFLFKSNHKVSLDRTMSAVTIYRCVYRDCFFKTKRRDNLARHKLFHRNISERLRKHEGIHSDSSIVTEYKYENEECHFERNHRLIHNNSTEATMYKCDIGECLYKTNRKSLLARHKLVHENPSVHKCGNVHCSYETKYRACLTKHKLKHMSLLKIRMYKCKSEGCTYETKHKYNLTMHELIHKDSSEVTMYKCESKGCSYETKRKHNLSRHILSHKDSSEVTMYLCESEGCSYETRNKSNLTKHELIHKDSSEITMYKCGNENCSFETKYKNAFALHKLRHKDPSEVTLFKCENSKCSFETKCKRSLGNHRLIHKDPSEVTMYRCGYNNCLYETKRKDSLARHQLIHKNLSGRLRNHKVIRCDSSKSSVYKCEKEECPFETKHKNNLTKHRLIHKDSTEVEMYKCGNEGCTHETKYKRNLAKHVLIHKQQ